MRISDSISTEPRRLHLVLFNRHILCGKLHLTVVVLTPLEKQKDNFELVAVWKKDNLNPFVPLFINHQTVNL